MMAGGCFGEKGGSSRKMYIRTTSDIALNEKNMRSIADIPKLTEIRLPFNEKKNECEHKNTQSRIESKCQIKIQGRQDLGCHDVPLIELTWCALYLPGLGRYQKVQAQWITQYPRGGIASHIGGAL